MATTAEHPMSPPRSPSRLPSPPPPIEDFTGPQSPALTTPEDVNQEASPALPKDAASRRIRPGTKAADMADGPPLVELSEIDSAFQLTEHLKALYHHYTHPTSTTISPLSKHQALLLSTPPPGIDRALWLYELCRFLVQKINSIITSLFADTPPCSSTTCPEMRASEWQYLCAVHDPPKACCAIDYCCHTLDWAANVLTSPKHFPSRLALSLHNNNTDTNTNPSSTTTPSTSTTTPSPVPQHQVRSLTNIFRRIYRIFAHAWFQHREMFWRVEHSTGLYVFFKTVCDVYTLIPADNYTIPGEAEGLDAAASSNDNNDDNNDMPRRETGRGEDEEPGTTQQAVSGILRRPTEKAHLVDASAASGTVVAAGSAAARRHRRDLSKTAPSSGVETVVEEAEEEGDVDTNNNNNEHKTGTTTRPTTLHDTATQVQVPQVKQESNSGFPDFDEEEKEEEESEEVEADAHGDDDSASDADTVIESSKNAKEERKEAKKVEAAVQTSKAAAADSDAAAESVQD